MELQLLASWNTVLASNVVETLLFASYKLKSQLNASWNFEHTSYIVETLLLASYKLKLQLPASLTSSMLAT